MEQSLQPAHRIEWLSVFGLSLIHLIAVAGILYAILVKFSWLTLALALLWACACGLSITGGYHRLFSHRTYACSRLLKVLYLLFGAASLQNSALTWCSDHRRHHANVDDEADPYNIKRGFWWAHIIWVFFHDNKRDYRNVGDLSSDKWVMWQHKYYWVLGIFVGFALPTLIASLWGDALGGFLIAGVVRLTLQYHATFSINSLTHYFGKPTFNREISARDNPIVAILTMGEGFHSFHHRFPTDYRNGIKAYHFDPTKWWVWLMSRIGMTWDLKRVPQEIIRRVKEENEISRSALSSVMK